MRKGAKSATAAAIPNADMPIYTRTGDSGETGIIGGKRVYKSDPQIEATGNIDELSSHLGLLILKVKETGDREFLTAIQKDLYEIMAFLAGSKNDASPIAEKTARFEEYIDALDKTLPRLTQFVIPQGTEEASLAHIARTVCRRAERSVVAYMRLQPKINEQMQSAVKYLNRLSDVLFMISRKYNKSHEETV